MFENLIESKQKRFTSLKQTPQVRTSSNAYPAGTSGSGRSMGTRGSPYAITAMARNRSSSARTRLAARAKPDRT